MSARRLPFSTRTLVLVAVGVVVATMIAVAGIAIATRGAGSEPDARDRSSSPSPSPDRTPRAGGGGGGHGSDGSGAGGSSDGAGDAAGGGQGAAGLRFTAFTHRAEVDCAGWGGSGKAPLVLSWSSANAVEAYWRGADTKPSSASAANGYRAPVSGSQGDLMVAGEPRGVFQECGHREFYHVVITLVGANGQTESRVASFRDISWNNGGQPEATIQAFTGPSTSGCLSPQAPAYQPSVSLTFSWDVGNARDVAFGIGTDDALNAPYETGLAYGGSITVNHSCSQASQRYTLTVVADDDIHVSRTITVVNPSFGS